VHKRDIVRDLGQLFVMGFDGLEVPPDVEEFFATFRIGGVILFRDNFEEPAQLTKLIDRLQARCASGLPLFVFVDQEGGELQNFRSGFPSLPAAATLGEGDPAGTQAAHTAMARALGDVGVNVTTVPVADLSAAGTPGSIGSRSFGTDPEIVSRHVVATVEAVQAAGLLSCVKHFPGHGATTGDSHRELPLSEIPALELFRDHLEPFRAAIAAGVDAVMTAHVVYGQSPDPVTPASLSAYWVEEVLRDHLRFGGLIVTDALEMKALRRNWSPFECGLQALNAGSDVLVYYREAFQFDAFNRVRYHVDAGDFELGRIAASIDRVRAAKEPLSG